MEEVDEEKCYQNNSSYTDAFSVLQQWRVNAIIKVDHF